MELRNCLIAAAAGASLLPASVLAGTESGFYVGAGVGQAAIGDLEDDFGNVSFDGDDVGW
jgi:hypothetical protein